jgi:hypothetical protein
MTTHRAPADTRSVGVAGIAVLVSGAVFVLLSFTTLTWYGAVNGPDSVGRIKFATLHHLTNLVGAPGLTKAYFAWAAWLLLILLIAVGLAANLPSPVTAGLRVLGLFVGLVGAAMTYYAIDRLFDGNVFTHAGAGVWLALVGYLVAGAGAALGPTRAR